MVEGDDIFIAGGGDEDVAHGGRVFHRGHFVTFHGGLQGANRIDLGYQYNGYNNGDLCASLSVMRKRGWNSNQQLAKALKELLERNLIVQTKQGGLNLGPNLYAITWQPINECNGKLDVNPTTVAPRSFR